MNMKFLLVNEQVWGSLKPWNIGKNTGHRERKMNLVLLLALRNCVSFTASLGPCRPQLLPLCSE